MSFLNWILLGGSAAFAAPLIIHLLNRTRFKVVEWGAMHLLDAALQVNSQRVQWQSILLLLLRCMIPILLALGLARPVFTSWRSAGGSNDKSIVILIDNSMSMQATGTSGDTHFQQAIDQAKAFVKRQSPSTEISLWTIGGQPTDILKGTTFDHARVSDKLENLSGDAGSAAVQSSIAAALKQVSSMQNASREIVVMSDFQDYEWSLFGESERTAIKQQLDSESIPIQLTLMPLSEPIAKNNLSIEIEPLEQPLVVVDQVFRVSAKLRSHAGQPEENVPLVLKVAGTEIASRRLAVPSNGATQAVFDCQISSPGTHAIHVAIEDSKGLPGDNIANRIVNVRAPLQVLLVDRQSNAPELQRDSGYLSLSLSPFQAGDSGKNHVVTRVINPDQLTKNEIANHDVLVLGDVSRLNDRVGDEVAAFVQQGGGMLLYSSGKIDKNWFNARWGFASKTPLLPAEYSPDSKPLTNVAHISEDLPTHPALSFFKQLGSENFSTVEVKSLQALKFNAKEDSVESAAHVLLKLESGEAFVIAKSFGAGNVLQVATSAGTSDTNLPLRPIYVPLMQSLVQWLAFGTDVPRNSIAGQPIAMKLPTKTGSDKTAPVATEQVAVLTLPNGTRVEEKLDTKGQLTFSDTAFPGIYSVAFNPVANASSAPAVEQFAVGHASEESELRFLTKTQIDELATETGATVAADAQDLLTMQSLRANGREAWRWFLLVLVAVLFVEIWWQQRITRGPL